MRLIRYSSKQFNISLAPHYDYFKKYLNNLQPFSTSMYMGLLKKYGCLLLLLFISGSSLLAQQPGGSDSLRTIEIVKGNSLRQTEIDSITLIETIAGDVVMKEGRTTFTCDSAVINRRTNVVEAFGKVHINDSDSIHTYSQYLKYVGTERIAYLKKKVQLTDGKGVLYTDDLEYNLASHIGIYKNGGKVVNSNTILTSKEGIYYADTKDVYFKKSVHLLDPRYDIRTDSLLYNTQSQIATFIAPTLIKSKNGVVETKSGTYNLKTGEAMFFERTKFSDSSYSAIADKMIYEEKTGILLMEGRGKLVDSANKVITIGNHIELNKKENTFLAFGKPVMIFYDKTDSTYIAADTLFSGLRKTDEAPQKNVSAKSVLRKKIADSLAMRAATDSAAIQPAGIGLPGSSAKDSLKMRTDSSKRTALPAKVISRKTVKLPVVDSPNVVTTPAAAKAIVPPIVPDSIATPITDSVAPALKDSLAKAATRPRNRRSTRNRVDTLVKPTAMSVSDTSIRYFLAFHHVRIFNDSVQSVCDSLYYSSEDSTFRLFTEPVVWNNNSQIHGDTIYMFTKNKNPERVYVFNNGLIVNKANAKMYNQVGGRTVNAYFKEGNIDYVRVKGSPAESIFYPQDDDSAYVGMNRSSGDVIDAYFVNKELNKVKFVNDVNGTMYPISQVPADKKELRGFEWKDKRRPKNKLELFE